MKHSIHMSRIAILRALFPPLTQLSPQGFLCVGGDLCPERLLGAYSLGIFPWYEDGSPILWWSLAPRCILFPEKLHISKRSRRTIRTSRFVLTYDKAFAQVIHACSLPRSEEEDGTWITKEMEEAYIRLHEAGYAHSVETWSDGELVGGLYGIGLENMFFGESMFHTHTCASRAALDGLVQIALLRGLCCIDCQQETPNMMSMGAECVSLKRFQELLQQAGLGAASDPETWKPWQETYDWDEASSSWSVKSKYARTAKESG